MRVCVLLATYDDASELREVDLDPEVLPHLEGHRVELAVIHRATADAQIDALVDRGFDVFLNLCDGAPDEARAGVEVVRALERRRAAFTGAGSAFFDPTRAEMRAAGERAGVRFPGGVFVRRGDDPLAAAARLRLPLFVKPAHGYSSVGVTPRSRVDDLAALPERVAAVADAFGEALVEEFVAGREFTVLVAEPGEGEGEPRVYPPLEVLFPPGETFKHFDLKWRGYDTMRPALVTDPALAARLQDASRLLVIALGGDGYGRCDLRLADDGEVVMLEINPNCGLFYPPVCWAAADQILATTPGGHRAFAEHLLACALRRQARAR